MQNHLKMWAALCCLFLFFSRAQAQYYPIKLVNNTAAKTNNVTKTYVIFTCQDFTAKANFCVLKLSYDSTRKAQVASTVIIQNNTDAERYSYQLDKLKGYDSASRSVMIYLPEVQSGRCMVSLNYPLSLPVIATDAGDTAFTFQAPSISNPADDNYQVVFDKFEFTFNQSATLYIDPTAVDFFSIPISLRDRNGNASGPGRKANRDTILKTIRRVLNKSNDSARWSKLLVTYPNDAKSIIRIDAPSDAPYFDSNYLNRASINYIDSLIKYYKKNSLRINCYELNTANGQVFQTYGQTPQQDSGAYQFTGKIDANGYWIFTNKPDSMTAITDTINMNEVTSNDFFGPGNGVFTTPNFTVHSILVEHITAAFTVGLLPAKNKQLLDSAYMQNSKKYYKTNKYLNLPDSTGPWYNLYTQAVHKAIPEIYAFAFDDLLGQSGTLQSSDTTDTVTVTLGNMGSVQLQPPPAKSVLACTVTYNSGFSLQQIGGASYYVDTLHWTNPTGQPANAGYFFVLAGGGATYTMTVDSGIYYQYVNNGKTFYSRNDTSGVIIVPASSLGSSAPSGIAMQIATCGGPNCPCDMRWLIKSPGNDSCAPASNTLVPASYNCGTMWPVQITYNAGFVKIDTNYVDTLHWRALVPPGSSQSACAQYMLMPTGGGSGFSQPYSSYLPYSAKNVYSSTDTSGVFVVPVSQWGTVAPDSVYMQVFTVGNPGCTVQSILSQQAICGPGSTPKGAATCCRVTSSSLLRKRKRK